MIQHKNTLLLTVIFISMSFLLTACPSPSPSGQATGNSYANSCGDYGESCCSDNYCYYGECRQGRCIHCGSFGELCCEQQSDGYQCEYGTLCVGGFCKATEDYTTDCGHVGYKACYYDGYYTCYSGVVDEYTAMCIACGDYDQPCCQYTDYPCDYGTCTAGYPYVGGTCKSSNNGNTVIGTDSMPTWDDSYDNSNTGNTGNTGNTENSNCGYMDGPCCEGGLQRDMFGMLTNPTWCNDGLECRAEVCVEGPDYEAYDSYNRPLY